MRRIINSGMLTKDTIMEADHNMVEQLRLETAGMPNYQNRGADEWFGYLAGLGLHDAEREEAGLQAKLYTRESGNKTSRLDKFMVPEAKTFHDGWQWKIDKEIQGPFQSDHAMLRARLIMPRKEDRGKQGSTENYCIVKNSETR